MADRAGIGPPSAGPVADEGEPGRAGVEWVGVPEGRSAGDVVALEELPPDEPAGSTVVGATRAQALNPRAAPTTTARRGIRLDGISPIHPTLAWPLRRPERGVGQPGRPTVDP